MTVDESLSEAVIRYVGLDASPVPGRHPERIPSLPLRAEVTAIVADLDAVRPNRSAESLFDWADREVENLLADRSPLTADAREALVSLLSFTWR